MVFNKFANITGQIDSDTVNIDSVLEDDIKLTEKELENIKFNLLKQGRSLLVDFANQTEKGASCEESNILEKLKNYLQDLTLTASVYKTLAKERALKPEELKDISFEIEHASAPINKTEINEMTRVYEENFQKHFKDNDAFRDAIVNGFQAKFGPDSKTNIFKYRKNDKLLAFLRVDDVQPGVKYFGSFNADLKGANIGQALLKTLIEQAGEDNIIEAHVIKSETKMLEMYIKMFGFKVVEEEPNYGNTGVDVIKIRRPATISSKSPEKTNNDNQQIEDVRNEIQTMQKAA